MSDGMRDCAAIGRQEQEVREAAHRLAVALKRASEGHRGWAISNLELEDIVNDYLSDEDAPFRVRVRT